MEKLAPAIGDERAALLKSGTWDRKPITYAEFVEQKNLGTITFRWGWAGEAEGDEAKSAALRWTPSTGKTGRTRKTDLIPYKGKEQSIQAWADELEMSRSVLH